MPTNQSLDPAHEEGAIRRRAADAAGGAAERTPVHPLLTLQRQVGNAAIARMLAQREGEENLDKDDETKGIAQAMHDPAIAQRDDDEPTDGIAQAKHDPAVAQRDDDDEGGPLQAKHDAALAQRDDDDEGGPLQAMPEVGLEGGPVSDGLAGRIQSARGGGAPLDGGTRDQMEGAFGTSFADVRVHADGESDALNKSISAKAFTTGNDVFLGKNANAGDTNLMAHELTHVVQQRTMSGGGGMTVGAAGDSYEQEADSMAQAVTSGTATNGPGTSQGAEGAEGVQREEAAPQDEETEE